MVIQFRVAQFAVIVSLVNLCLFSIQYGWGEETRTDLPDFLKPDVSIGGGALLVFSPA